MNMCIHLQPEDDLLIPKMLNMFLEMCLIE